MSDTDSTPTPTPTPTSSSSLPPSYSSPVPSEDDSAPAHQRHYPTVPSISKRKSSTIISIISPEEDIDSINAERSRLDRFYDEESSEEDRDARAGPSTRFFHNHDGPPSLSQTLALPPHMRSHDLERTWSNSSSSASIAEAGESTSLLSDEEEHVEGKWYNGPLFTTAVKLGVLFLIFTAVVVGTFYFGIPKMDPEDRGVLKLPRSFSDLQALNNLFQKYKHRNPYRILACGVVSYLFVQTFSLPGSMYISILFGAAYGIIYGLLLSCLCESVGSVFCYTLSSLLAPPLLALPFYRARVETWRTKIMGDPKKGKQVTWDGVFAFLIVLRIAPFPPHWVANFVAPHLGIGVFLFWASCFIGIAPVSVIHVTIGSSLDSMTSAADFHILSLRNVLGLCAVVVAVLIPVGLKRVFRNDLGDLGEAEGVFEETGIHDREVEVPAVGDGQARRYHAIDSGVVLAAPSKGIDGMDMRSKIIKGKGRALEIIPDADEDEDEEEDIARLLGEAIDGEEEEDGEEGAGESSSAPTPRMPGFQRSISTRSTYIPTEEDYEIYDTRGRIHRIKVSNKNNLAKSFRPNTLNGYGSIQAQPQSNAVLAVAGPGEREMSAGGWWPFARTGVA